jgi:hypothetical protein
MFLSPFPLSHHSRAQQNAEALLSGFSGTKITKNRPPPLLRSRTLPSIIVPGITILQAHDVSTAGLFL